MVAVLRLRIDDSKVSAVAFDSESLDQMKLSYSRCNNVTKTPTQ